VSQKKIKKKLPRQLGEALRPSETPLEIKEANGELTVGFPGGPPPRPEHVYCADRALFAADKVQVSLVFVQLDPIDRAPVTAVHVYYSPDCFRRLLDRTLDFFEKLSAYVQGQFGPELETALPAFASGRVTKMHKERATFERMAFREGDAEIEFYSVSPLRMSDAQQQRRPVDGLVRPCLAVALPSVVLYFLLRDAYGHFQK
jgi:hypothetical protein